MNYLNRLPSLNALKAFIATAEQGSISTAAQLLNVTHGAVSRQIRLLEEELNTALTEKHGRSIKLTDAGQQLYQNCQPAFRTLADSCQHLRQQHQEKPLVLACSGSLLARWLIPRLPSLQQALADLPLQLVTSADDENPQQQADLSLSFIDNPKSGERLIPLEQERIGPVLSPSLAKQLRLQPGQPLPDLPLLHTLSRPQAWPDWTAHNGIASDTLNMGQGFPHLSYLLEAVLAGLGIGIAPVQLVRSDLEQGRLLAPWGFVSTHAWLCLHIHNPAQHQRIDRLTRQLATLI